jgi:hypothetical protein
MKHGLLVLLSLCVGLGGCAIEVDDPDATGSDVDELTYVEEEQSDEFEDAAPETQLMQVPSYDPARPDPHPYSGNKLSDDPGDLERPDPHPWWAEPLPPQ